MLTSSPHVLKRHDHKLICHVVQTLRRLRSFVRTLLASTRAPDRASRFPLCFCCRLRQQSSTGQPLTSRCSSLCKCNKSCGGRSVSSSSCSTALRIQRSFGCTDTASLVGGCSYTAVG